MRKFTLFLMSLFLTVGAMAQVNYTPTNSGVKTNTGRNMTSVVVGSTTYTLASGENGQCYVDKYNAVTFEVEPGQTYALEVNTGGSWIHSYVFVDFKSDGFTASVTGSYKPADDLVAYSFYNNNASSDASGWNSVGTSISGDNRNRPAIPSWTVPADLASGEYRIRFKLDWCNIDPDGDKDGKFGDFMANGGQILDAKLVVKQLPRYTIVYNYKQNDVLVGSVEHQVVQGSEYPALVSGLYNVTVNGSKPTGTVTEDAEFDIDVTLGVFPFEYYEDYAAVEEANGWYNLIMHSNWNTGAAAARYRTYVGAGDETNLAWGTERSLTNPTKDYYWAFVGNPITGFSIVNKAKGTTHILSSNGSTNPVMLEAESLANGYNTTWQIRERKYNVSQQGDYILEGAWFCLKYPNSSNYINANAGNGNVAFWNDNDNGSAILAVKPLTINEAADVATYYSDNYIVKPTGAEVYYVNNVEDGYAKFAEVTGDNIPAQNGVVVKFTTNENIVYAPEITSAGATAAIEGNMLKGTTKRTLITKETNKAYYVLGMTKGVGFYNAVNGENEGEFYNGAYKAYLEIEGANETATFYGFDWAGTTGINEVKGENGNVKTIYDLTGRRIEAITAPGIYIVGGKKVLVK